MVEPTRIRDLRIRIDRTTADRLTDAALRDRVVAGLPPQLDRTTAEATAVEVVTAIRSARRRSS